MEILISILLALLLITAIVWLVRTNRKNRDAGFSEPVNPVKIDPECCGAHEICEFDAVRANPSLIEYFDDEELDQLCAIDPANYSESQIDQLRGVLYTLNAHEIRNWLLSLERRGIHLPDFLKEEARDLQLNS